MVHWMIVWHAEFMPLVSLSCGVLVLRSSTLLTLKYQKIEQMAENLEPSKHPVQPHKGVKRQIIWHRIWTIEVARLRHPRLINWQFSYPINTVISLRLSIIHFVKRTTNFILMALERVASKRFSRLFLSR